MFGNHGGANTVYQNDGTGQFTDVTATALAAAPSDMTTSVALGDVDGDGTPDLFVANEGESCRLYLNDGSGAFTDVTAVAMPPVTDAVHDVALVDVDGDTDLDAVLAVTGAANRLLQNDGSGVFTDVTASADALVQQRLALRRHR